MHDALMDLSLAIKAAELLTGELQRARSEHEKRLVVGRILSQELERIDALILIGMNSEPPALPSLEALVVPAWDQHQDAINRLFDTATWEATKDAVTLPAQVVRQLREQQAGAEVRAGILDLLHKANVLARVKLVKYTSKDGLVGTLERAAHDDRIDRRNDRLDEG